MTRPLPGNLVGVRGFEPPTLYTPCRCATWLRYTPTESALLTGAEFMEMTLPCQQGNAANSSATVRSPALRTISG
ncbi:hypothetical protein AERO8C_140286 [Aeromonas veronii]|uniref:Uncharacterized protein n=1 Tax=Aeromonas veronii TaxID=654 RepID=A0A653KWN2_AERVE|nr:hypothetical protein AERO8C_140286 [Aeromonas veronii]